MTYRMAGAFLSYPSFSIIAASVILGRYVRKRRTLQIAARTPCGAGGDKPLPYSITVRGTPAGASPRPTAAMRITAYSGRRKRHPLHKQRLPGTKKSGWKPIRFSL